MLPKWERCRDCAEGEDAVKAQGEKYLPKRDSHRTLLDGAQRYEAYKSRALFYNATGRTVDGLCGLVMQKPPALNFPKAIEEHGKDLTLSGVSSEMFALETLRENVKKGRYGILVEWSESAGRPYWAARHAEQIVNWRVQHVGGDAVLVRVVLREDVEEPNPLDPFEDVCLTQYRVLELVEGKYQQTVWRKPTATGVWTADTPIIPVRRGEALPFIPFVFISPFGIGVEPSKPPIIDLVNVNLSHYKNMADLENGLHYVGTPTLVTMGLNQDANKPVMVGAGAYIGLPVGGDAKILQADGELLGALERADDRKRNLMASLGARMLEDQPKGAETATAVGMRHSSEHANLKTIAGSTEAGLTMAAQWHAWWVGTEAKPEDTKATFELNKEFFAAKMAPEEQRVMVATWQGQGISRKTLYYNFERGGITRPGVTYEQELREIQQEDAPAPEPEPTPDDNPGPTPPPKPGAPPAPMGGTA
jgi:hypothetical protein